jgi:hypothetical protein
MSEPVYTPKDQVTWKSVKYLERASNSGTRTRYMEI